MIAICLCACGGGSDTSQFAPGPVAATANDTLTTIFDGQMLPARGISLRNTISGGALAPHETDVSYGYDAASQELTVQVGDVTRVIDLTRTDPDFTSEEFYVQVNDVGEFTVFAVEGSRLNAFLDGTSFNKYLIPIISFVQDSSAQHIDRSYGIVGLHTPSAYLRSSEASARYEGKFLIQARQSLQLGNENRHSLVGDSAMNVNFGSALMAGGTLTITSESIGTNPSQARTGTISLAPASIDADANRFDAALTSTAAGLTLDAGATATGGFYGHEAQEIGGSIEFSGQLDARPVLAGGVFYGTKR